MSFAHRFVQPQSGHDSKINLDRPICIAQLLLLSRPFSIRCRPEASRPFVFLLPAKKNLVSRILHHHLPLWTSSGEDGSPPRRTRGRSGAFAPVPGAPRCLRLAARPGGASAPLRPDSRIHAKSFVNRLHLVLQINKIPSQNFCVFVFTGWELNRA